MVKSDNQRPFFILLTWYNPYLVLNTIMALSFWLDHFLDFRAEIHQILTLVFFFGKLKTPNRYSEINWPLISTLWNSLHIAGIFHTRENQDQLYVYTAHSLLSAGWWSMPCWTWRACMFCNFIGGENGTS